VARPTKEERCEACLRTVWAIARSPSVEQFVIGYTYRSGEMRRREYHYDHVVILAEKLNRIDALNLEGCLQSAIKKYPQRASYRKYC
jgi:hypothetical protein